MRRLTTCGPRRPIVGLAVAAVVAGGPRGGANALAQDDAEPIRLSYRATGAGCPDEASFVARVRERTKRVRLAWTGETARTFAVVVDAGPPPSGQVAVQAGNETQGVRRVQADTCADVADALALVVALAIDPRAGSAISPAPAPIVAAPSPPSKVPAPAARPAGEGPAGFVGVDLALATGVTPSVLVGGSLYIELRLAGAALLQPSFRLAFVHADSGAVDVPGGKVAWSWTVQRLDVCPIVWPRGSVRVTECARIEAGTLEGARADVTLPPSQPNPWFAAGLLARAEWSPLAWAFIDAELGGLVRVTQDRFRFTLQDQPFYEVPAIGMTTGFGVGVRFF